MLIKSRLILAVALLFLSPISAQAVVKIVEKSDPHKKQALPCNAKIVFTAEIKDESVAELAAVLNELYTQHPTINDILIYINSHGGSISSGFTAYWAIKSVPEPVKITMINLFSTSSAATLPFCAVKREYRKAMPNAFFLLHPVRKDAYPYESNNLMLDQLDSLVRSLKNDTDRMLQVYKNCISLSEEAIKSEEATKDFLYSEANNRYLDFDQAVTSKLISAEAETVIVDTDISYYISD